MCGCKITNSNIPVNLKEIKASDLSAIGSTTAPSTFDIPMTCDPGVSVAYQIDGTADVSKATGVLAIQKGSGMATGVGVQVLQGSNPVALGTLSPTYIVTTSSAQGVNIPLTARYYKNNATVTGGKVSAIATFTMNYQ
jgi:type 1 fimbria pilin